MNEIAPRVPPHNLDAEQAVLGSILLEPSTFEYCSHLPREAFYSERHKYIWDALCKVITRGDRPDTVTLVDQLRVNQKLEFVGGLIYVAGLPDCVPTALYCEAYSKIVEERFVLREIIYKADHLTNHAYHAKDLQLVLDEASQLGSNLAIGSGPKQITQNQLSSDFMSQIRSGNAPESLPTGLKPLDYVLGGGLEKGRLYIIAARPSMGKSALMMQIAYHIASQHRGQVAVFSLEMDANQINDRLISMLTKVSINDIRMVKRRQKFFDERQMAFIERQSNKLSELPLTYYEDPSQSLSELSRELRRLKSQEGLAALFVDYLQLITVPGVENEVDRISRISRQLKVLARELDIPIIALSQLSRAVEGQMEKRPMLSHLRSSGSIEQDADAVMMLFRPGYYDKNLEIKSNGMEDAELAILKNRDGQTKTIALQWEAARVRFWEIEP